jgi:hypothetical protein
MLAAIKIRKSAFANAWPGAAQTHYPHMAPPDHFDVYALPAEAAAAKSRR